MSNLAKNNVVEMQQVGASALVKSLNAEDKATIMQLCMPSGATDSDLAMYLHRCKELGFDPLGGDLVLQKRTSSKTGEISLNFITTRDAMLKKAESNPNYDGMNSGVVKEGDVFAVDTQNGVVKHQFGAKRGKIVAGWAVVYHKQRKPVVFTSDFLEYSVSNANSPVWRSMPSAMVQKVAEVGALRRQFPVGGQVYTNEEIELEEQTEPRQIESVEDEQTTVQNETMDTALAAGMDSALASVKEQIAVQKSESQEPTIEPVAEPAKDVYKLVNFITGKSGTGVPFGKIQAEKDGEPVLFLAKGEEGLAESAKLTDNCEFTAVLAEENGFQMVTAITLV